MFEPRIFGLNGRRINDSVTHRLMNMRLPESPSVIDLRFNNLQLHGLRSVVEFFRTKPLVSACVGENWFRFEPFFRLLADMAVDEWIDAERLTMGWTMQQRAQDKLAARLLRENRSLSELQATMRLIEESHLKTAQTLDRMAARGEEAQIRSEKLGEENQVRLRVQLEGINKTLDRNSKQQAQNVGSIANLIGYNSNRDHQIEEEVRATIESHLEGEGYDIVGSIPQEFLKVKRPDWTDLVEWDGAIVCEKGDEKILVLVEAKHYLCESHVEDMPTRLERTATYLSELSQHAHPAKTKHEYKFRQQCVNWGVCAGCRLKGAVGGPVVTKDLKQAVLDKGYLCVCKAEEDYQVFVA